jgi:hypothetical protein
MLGPAGNAAATNVDPQRILKIARDLFLLGEVLSNPDKLRHIRTFAHSPRDRPTKTQPDS